MALLAQRLDLGNLIDVEAFCARIVARQLASAGGYLEPADRDDAVTYLIGETWVLWTRFDDGKGATFWTYSSPVLQRRMVDWYRARFGRASNAPRPRMVSTDELENAELERALSRGAGDDPAHSVTDLAGVLAGGGREPRGLE